MQYTSGPLAGSFDSAPSGMLVQPPNIRPPAQSSAPTGMTGAQAGGAQVLWTFTSDDEVRSSPMCERGLVFSASYDTNLYALNAKTGDFLEGSDQGRHLLVPVLAGDAVVIGSEDNFVYAFDARRGTPRGRIAQAAPYAPPLKSTRT